MGTRSTIKFFEGYEDTKRPICSIYQQYDGYPSCVGLELAKFLNNRTMINGFGLDMTMDNYANGLGCLSAQYVAHIKDSIGGVYMTSSDDSQLYDYEVVSSADTLKITVEYSGKRIFDGRKEEFLDFCQKDDEEE